MKKANILTLAVLAATVLTGCSNDDELTGTQQSVLPDDNVIRLEAGVNNMQTRAVGYAENGLAEFGLFVENENNSTYTFSNVYMKKDDSGIWASYKSDKTTPWLMLWQNESTPVNVTAYAPYNENTNLGNQFTGNVESNQTIVENGRKSDVLYAAASVTPNAPETSNDIYYDTNTKKLNVKMGHVLSKLTVNIRYGTEMTQNGATPSLTSVTLGETQTGYTMDLTSGSVSATGGKSEINMMLSDVAVEGYSKSAEAILVPQSAAFTITVIVGERTFVYNNEEFAFKEGNAYTLNLLVGKDITNIEDISASEWATDESGNLETE